MPLDNFVNTPPSEFSMVVTMVDNGGSGKVQNSPRNGGNGQG